MTNRLLGVGFLLIVAVLLAASVLTYLKAFTPIVPVTLRADRTGTQLLSGADVKLRGLIVGEVRAISTDGATASLALALNPDDVGLIPSNVQARLLPKTLFGEKFVDLVIPRDASPRAISAGAVITQDRSRTAIELERVLGDVLPLLRTIDPAKLAATLHAMATALEGRGEKLGEILVRLESYLDKINPELPTIKADIKALAGVADVYADAAPDLLTVLRNLSVTNATVNQQRTQLAAFTASTTRFADTTTGFLTEHEGRLIQLAAVSRPTLELLARYSPEFPCLLRGLTDFQPLIEDAFGGRSNSLHITLEIVQDQGKYQPGRDEPQYGAKSGPSCRGLPGPPVPYPGKQFADGYDHGNRRSSTPIPRFRGLTADLTGAGGGGDSASAAGDAGSVMLTDAAMGYAGTAQEQSVVGPLLALVMRRPAQEVPDIATLLFGPMARGTMVRVS
jgi:phospholipid/cholesterol/gamma-HCH transport system substrate-binding protein